MRLAASIDTKLNRTAYQAHQSIIYKVDAIERPSTYSPPLTAGVDLRLVAGKALLTIDIK